MSGPKLIGSLVVFIGLAALTVQRHAAREAVTGYATTVAQAAADAAALAGASSLIEAHGDVPRARDRALESIRANDDAQPRTRLRGGDILVKTDEGTITVEVEARVQGLPSGLARFLGVPESVVTAVATAQGQSVRCVDTSPRDGSVWTQRCEGIVKYLGLIDDAPPRSTGPLSVIRRGRRTTVDGKPRHPGGARRSP